MNICTGFSASLVLLKLEVISPLHFNLLVEKFCGIFQIIAAIRLWQPSKTHQLPKQSAPKNVFYSCIMHCKPIPVMKTGFSLCIFSHREKPVFITWETCNENRFFFCVGKYKGKTLFWPCTGPVRDCSAFNLSSCLEKFD